MPRIVTPVRRKPTEVCSARALPAVPGGDSSLTAVENCAESATTVMPHTTTTARMIQVGAPNSRPAATALEPDNSIAAIVRVVRPRRSASAPAATQPSAPPATTRNAIALAAGALTSPLTARLAARKVGTQGHIAYR